MDKNYILIYKFTIDDKSFYRDSKNNIINDDIVLNYIKKLVIPPAYTNVKVYYPISNKVPLKILYEGYDKDNRKQVIYSKEWNYAQNKLKYQKLVKFIQIFPKINKDINKHISSVRITKNKLISIILKIIFYCNFRIGGLKYEKLYNTIGISNVKVKHIKLLENSKINIEFIGKKKVLNTCTVDDAFLYSNISQLISNKNEESNVFQHSGIVVSEIDVNNFLKQYNPEFSTKMLRTMNANVYLIDSINKNYSETLLSDIKHRKKYIVSIIKDIAKDINNTPAVAKKNYINNDIIDVFLNNPKKYKKYFINKNSSVGNLINFLIKF